MTPSGIPDGDFEETPLEQRIGEVYWLRVRDTGLGQEQAAAIRGELEGKIADCVDHFQRTAPDEVANWKKRSDATIASETQPASIAGCWRNPPGSCPESWDTCRQWPKRSWVRFRRFSAS